MNIRLDKDVRIRLDEQDLNQWESGDPLIQTFQFGILKFNLQIKPDPTIPQTRVVNEHDGLTILLSTQDSKNLFEKTIAVDSIHIEVDKWSKKTRSQYEEKIKKNRS